MKHPPLRITDHAVLRFMERAMGIDIEAVRATIAARVAPAALLEAAAIEIDGLRYVIKTAAVVTVEPASMAMPDRPAPLPDPGEANDRAITCTVPGCGRITPNPIGLCQIHDGRVDLGAMGGRGAAGHRPRGDR